MTSYLHLRLSRDRRSLEEEVCRLRLGRLLALDLADCTLTIGHAKPNSAQLRASRLRVFDLKKGGPVAPGPTVSNRYAGCLRQSAVHLPNSAQLQPNRPIFVLKNFLRLGWPTRLPIPRHDCYRALRMQHHPIMNTVEPSGYSALPRHKVDIAEPS